MSVINKMLRDLDQRTPSAAGTRAGITPLGTGVVFEQEGAGRRARYGLIASLAVALAGLAAAVVWWQVEGRSDTVTVVAQLPAAIVERAASAALPAAPAPSAQAAASAADRPAAVAPVASSTPAQAGPAPMQGEIETPSLPRAQQAKAPTTRVDASPAAKASMAPLPAPNISLRMETALELRPPKEPASISRASSIPTAASRPQPAPAPGPIVNAATAAQDALAQAQTLWNAGSKDAAVELLRDAVVIAERGVPSGGSATLIPLVRELTRMQLADGHFGAVWDLLNRLEPHLGNQADLWAIRANAAQRLGRHQDSVHAYMVALQSRPSEQRWLLGSAVSLAALGQTSGAAEMAEKARAAGPISKDVQAYLRQMNVPLRD